MHALQHHIGFAPTLTTSLLDTRLTSFWETVEESKTATFKKKKLYEKSQLNRERETRRVGGGQAGVCVESEVRNRIISFDKNVAHPYSKADSKEPL